MANAKNQEFKKQFAKARDLKMVVKFEKDESPEGIIRTKQVREIICQLIMLGQKKGRPSQREENLDEAA